MTGSSNKSLGPGEGARLIDQFLEMMSAERGASRNTLEAYRRALKIYPQLSTVQDLVNRLAPEVDGLDL